MSDQTPREEVASAHCGFTLATCQLTLEFATVPLAGGRNDNVSLVTYEDGHVAQPIGFVNFLSPNPGPNSISGMLPNRVGGHALFVILFNKGPQDITLLEEDVNSFDFARFDFGGAGPQLFSAGKSTPITWDPDSKRWKFFG